MKLVAEQIKLLRERKAELIRKRDSFTDYLANHRENDKMDGIGNIYTDYVENERYRKEMKEIDDIEHTLAHSEFVTDRNFDQIDVGTAFYAHFVGDDEAERVLLVEKGVSNNCDYHMVSLESDFGKAIHGKTDGDTVVYTVEATGRKIGVTVDSLDRIKAHYEHFIRENKADRTNKRVERYLGYLKEVNPRLYELRQRPTASQKELISEELIRENTMSPSRRAFLQRVLARPTAVAPKDSIGAGSHVSIAYQNDEGELEERSFEMINRAFSTELESHYVELTSTLGNALEGLKLNDTFKVKRKNKPSIKGIVTGVEKYKNTEIRVK